MTLLTAVTAIATYPQIAHMSSGVHEFATLALSETLIFRDPVLGRTYVYELLK